MQSSCVNNEIKSFNRKLLKHVKAHQHVSILEISDDRKLLTTHGLHLNGLSKDKLPKQIVSLIYNTRTEEGPSNNLELELGSESFRYTASRLRCK
jgi:hypothetical protein